MSEDENREALNGGELVYRVANPEAMRFEDAGGDVPPVVEGRMMPYDTWTEVRSPIEGHFLERFAPGSLAKTMTEQANRIRVMFEHGFDSVFGRQVIATADEMRDAKDGAYYRASLLHGVPDLLVSGLRKGLYGSSIRFAPVKWDRVRAPAISEHNPTGLPEHTIREAAMKEFSFVSFPQYAGATASVRAATDDYILRQLLRDPDLLLGVLNARKASDDDDPAHVVPPESQHSEESEPEKEPASRTEPQHSATPAHDYLAEESEEKQWRL